MRRKPLCHGKRRTERLQYCFNELSGLGQDAELTLEDPGQQDRVDGFIDRLRQCKESVAYFGLTLDSLLTRVVLPGKDQPIFLKMMQDIRVSRRGRLSTASRTAPICEVAVHMGRR